MPYSASFEIVGQPSEELMANSPSSQNVRRNIEEKEKIRKMKDCLSK